MLAQLNTSNYHSSKKLTYALGVNTNRHERSYDYCTSCMKSHAYANLVSVPYFFNVCFELLLKTIFLTLLEVGEIIGPICSDGTWGHF